MSDDRTTMIGSVGRTVIANIEQLRKARGLSLRELAARLADLGRPVGDTVLHRQSQGKRRIDSDDLIAFALALGVNPNALLFDRRAKPGDALSLTPTFQQRADVTWQWAEGGGPLPDHLLGEGEPLKRTLAKEVDFATNAQPDLAARRNHPAVLAAGQLITVFLRALLDRDEETGEWKDEAARDQWREDVNRALQRLSLEIDDEFAGGPPSFYQPQTAVRGQPAARTGHGRGSSGGGGTDGRL